jgi:tRNA(fMet)-specific endonuclease VapC
VYLLDTNIISELAKNPSGLAAQRFASEPREMLCTSVIVSAEVLFGLRNGEVARQTSRAMMAVLDYLHIFALEPKVAEAYAEVRTVMKKTGLSITPNDFFIAAHALTLGATLVTADQAFRFVPGLKVENWIRA